LTGRLCGDDGFIRRIESEKTGKTTQRPKILAVAYFQAIIEVENRLRKDESFRKNSGKVGEGSDQVSEEETLYYDCLLFLIHSRPVAGLRQAHIGFT
jgi:hypothetical protein